MIKANIIHAQNEEKIKYSKWKAAEIAKAFREGRKPAPGPPGWAEEQEELRRILQEQADSQNSPEIATFPSAPSGPTSSSPPRSSHIDASTSRHSPTRRSPTSSSPPKPTHIHVDRSLNGWNNGPTDETWSNAATPGGDPPDTAASVYTIGSVTPSTAGYDLHHTESPTRSSTRSKPPSVTTKPRSGSGSSSNTISSTGSKGVLKKSSSKTSSPDSDKRVHFSPSTAGTPAAPPHAQLPTSGSSPKQQYTGPNSIYAPTASPTIPTPPPHTVYPSKTSPTSQYPSTAPPPPSSSSPTRQNYIYGPPKQASPVRYAPPPPPPAPVASVEVELTPALISKVQRHCRFAISSLDYEDAEQAKKELRAALALLGG
jgi:vacuolar protein sorting-associated protein VTA1